MLGEYPRGQAIVAFRQGDKVLGECHGTAADKRGIGFAMDRFGELRPIPQHVANRLRRSKGCEPDAIAHHGAKAAVEHLGIVFLA
ncbi:hypothetical protein D3C87_2081770 [compost metagenome]